MNQVQEIKSKIKTYIKHWQIEARYLRLNAKTIHRDETAIANAKAVLDIAGPEPEWPLPARMSLRAMYVIYGLCLGHTREQIENKPPTYDGSQSFVDHCENSIRDVMVKMGIGDLYRIHPAYEEWIEVPYKPSIAIFQRVQAWLARRSS